MISLMDFLNRHQIYIEGVKNWYHDDFRRYLRLFRAELRKLFGRLNVGTLGELTKAKFRGLLSNIEKAGNKVFGQYGTEFLTEMRRFMGADVLVQRAGFAAAVPAVDVTGSTIPRVWKDVKDSIVPAIGKTPLEATTELVTSIKERVRVAINSGYADNKTLAEIEADFDGDGPDYKGGVFGRVWSGVRAHVSTLFQHAASKITDTLGGFVYDSYQWVSVIDGVTSDICRDRNGNVYRRGEGPLPPAHQNCRSRTIPCPSDTLSGEGVPTYFGWLSRQSKDFLSDVFGDGPADDIALGRAKAAEYGKFTSVARLTIDEFSSRVNRLIS